MQSRPNISARTKTHCIAAIIALVTLAALLLIIVPSASATTISEFTGNSLGTFVISLGGATVTNGVCSLGGASSIHTTNQYSEANWVLECDFYVSAYNTGHWYHMFGFGSGTYVNICMDGYWMSVNNGQGSYGWGTNINPSAATWHHLKLVAYAGHFQYYLDGTLVHDLTGYTPSGTGYVYLATDTGQNMQVKNFYFNDAGQPQPPATVLDTVSLFTNGGSTAIFAGGSTPTISGILQNVTDGTNITIGLVGTGSNLTLVPNKNYKLYLSSDYYVSKVTDIAAGSGGSIQTSITLVQKGTPVSQPIYAIDTNTRALITGATYTFNMPHYGYAYTGTIQNPTTVTVYTAENTAALEVTAANYQTYDNLALNYNDGVAYSLAHLTPSYTDGKMRAFFQTPSIGGGAPMSNYKLIIKGSDGSQNTYFGNAQGLVTFILTEGLTYTWTATANQVDTYYYPLYGSITAYENQNIELDFTPNPNVSPEPLPGEENTNIIGSYLDAYKQTCDNVFIGIQNATFSILDIGLWPINSLVSTLQTANDTEAAYFNQTTQYLSFYTASVSPVTTGWPSKIKLLITLNFLLILVKVAMKAT